MPIKTPSPKLYRSPALLASLITAALLFLATSAQAQFTKIEAETYTANAGVQTENTDDSGGGLNVGYITTGDWAEYTIDVPTAGSYQMNFRVASGSVGGTINILAGGVSAGSIAVASTAGWQTWKTISTAVNFSSAGSQTLRFNFTGDTGISLFNYNWFTFVQTPILTEAEDFTAMSGIVVEAGKGATTDSIGYIYNGDWAEYSVAIPIAGEYQITFSAASNNDGGNVDIVVGGATLGTVTIPKTSGWDNWTDFSTDVTFANAGTQTVRLNFVDEATSALYNMDSFTIEIPEIAEPLYLYVEETKLQQMRYGIDYERLWYWYGDSDKKERVAEWSVVDCDLEYVRVAINAKYELTEVTANSGSYDLSGYTSKIIPMMQSMQAANPDIKFFASPRPLDEAYSSSTNVSWQPYPTWITGSSSLSSSSFDFNYENCAEYLVRYLRLMKSYGFKISYMDLTNEWNQSSSGGRLTPTDFTNISEYLDDYAANTPSPDPTDPSGFYSSFPTLTPEDIPLLVGPSSWNFPQGVGFINNINTPAELAALDIASAHNTDKTGTAEDFATAARNALGDDAEIWNTELHGWKSTSSADEVLTYAFMMEAINAGFTGLSGWLAIGTTNQGHSYILNTGDPTRNVKYYMFEKLTNTSHRGYALEINQPDELDADSLDANAATSALIRGNLMTVWVLNHSDVDYPANITAAGRTFSDFPIISTRWSEVHSLALEGVTESISTQSDTTFEATVKANSAYCYEILLEPEGLPYKRIEAESFDSSDTGGGATYATEICSDTDDGLNLSNMNKDTWTSYANLDLSEATSIRLRVARPAGRADGVIEIRIGSETGPRIGRVAVPVTSGWQTWQTIETPLDSTSGIHDVYLTYIEAGSNQVNSGSMFNLNWFELVLPAEIPSGIDTTPTSSTQIDLSWAAVPDAIGYTVKRSTSEGGPYTVLDDTITATSYSDTDVSAGVQYYYVIVTRFDGYESELSVELLAVPSNPIVIENVIVDQLAFPAEQDSAIFSIQNSELGHMYQGQEKKALTDLDWLNIGSPIPGNGGALEFTFPIEAADPTGFYRIQIWQQ